MAVTKYIVAWPRVTMRVEAGSPEEAAEKAVDEHPQEWDNVHGIEVAVYERVLSRHDVIVGDSDAK